MWFQKLRKFLGENLDTFTVLKSVPAPGMPKGDGHEVTDFKQTHYMFNKKLNQIDVYRSSGALKLVQVIDPFWKPM